MAFKMKKFSGFGNKKTPLKKEEEKEKTSNFDKFAKIGRLQAESKEGPFILYPLLPFVFFE